MTAVYPVEERRERFHGPRLEENQVRFLVVAATRFGGADTWYLVQRGAKVVTLRV
jgi:hypothetical protein